MARRIHLVVVACMVALCSQSAKAELIGFTLPKSPDIFSAFIDVSYDAITDVMVADGYSLTYYDGSASQPIIDGHFNITANIAAGGVLLGGSLLIEGSVGSYGPLLLTGLLTDFGYLDPPGGDLFDFLFTVTGGDMASEFGGLGGTIGVILDANDGADFDGTFNTSFNNLDNNVPGTGQGVADTGFVPAPSAIGLFLVGLFATRRRRQF